MGKIIKITDEYKEECCKEFEAALDKMKFADGRLSFTKIFGSTDRKAKIIFSGISAAKLIMLLGSFDKEVAWHGVCHRSEDETKDEYYITDLLVYPQKVTGTNVEMDEEEYAKWLEKNIDDERFDDIHMQGHSHVMMATSPSSVDLHHQEIILNSLGPNNFYIFMIWNKALANTNKIYDMKKNIMFEDKDITVEVEGQHESLSQFLVDAKKLVTDRTYGGYTGSYSNKPAAIPPKTPVPSAGKPETKTSKETKSKPKPKSYKKNEYNHGPYDDYDDYNYYSDCYGR